MKFFSRDNQIILWYWSSSVLATLISDPTTPTNFSFDLLAAFSWDSPLNTKVIFSCTIVVGHVSMNVVFSEAHYPFKQDRPVHQAHLAPQLGL